MATRPGNWSLASSLPAFVCALVACDPLGSSGPSPPMSRGEGQTSTLNGVETTGRPTIGALAHRVPIRSRPSSKAPVLGFLTAGASVGRAEQPATRDDCLEGWYEVLPRGFLCLDAQTTLEPRHPTLQARGLRANHLAALPYPYATTRRALTLFEPDPEHRDGVRERGRLSKGSTFAVVGSWETLDEYDQRQRLAMLTHGTFVPARDIEPLRLDSPLGVELDGTTRRLPLGFLLSETAPTFRFSGSQLKPHAVLDSKKPVGLTVKSRSYEGERYLLLADDDYIAERDVAIARQRQEFPDFVTPSAHWVDIDVTQGLIVMYIGEHPSYALRTRVRPNESLARGTAWVKRKQLTELSSGDPPSEKRSEFDAPWVVELDSGVTLRSSFRVRTDTSTSPSRTIELHPEDAARLFRFLSPTVPDGWHAAVATDPKHESSAVVLR